MFNSAVGSLALGKNNSLVIPKTYFSDPSGSITQNDQNAGVITFSPVSIHLIDELQPFL